MTRLRVLLVGFAAFMFAALPAAAVGRSWEPLPPHPGGRVVVAPQVSAPSWILFDDTADWVIASHDPDEPRPPASTTKMMTALVAADHASLEEIVVIDEAAIEVGESEIGLVAGEEIAIGDLIAAMLIRSANDAAVAIAIDIGGSIEGFAELMNDKAEELGLNHSHFVNPHGLDEPDHFSSATDLLAMSEAILDNPQLAAIVRSRTIDFPAAPDGTERGGEATNLLLETYEGAIGVKTGYTDQASLVLAAAAERDGRRLLAVVMGSEGPDAHFLDVAAMLDYGFHTARLMPLLGGRQTLGDISLNPIAAAARLEALTWLGASGLLGAPDSVEVGTPVAVHREVNEVPGLREAFDWLPRYWSWIVGDG